MLPTTSRTTSPTSTRTSTAGPNQSRGRSIRSAASDARARASAERAGGGEVDRSRGRRPERLEADLGLAIGAALARRDVVAAVLARATRTDDPEARRLERRLEPRAGDAGLRRDIEDGRRRSAIGEG